MKHLRGISDNRERTIREFSSARVTGPVSADAKTDFLNAMWRAWSDYTYQKKTELSV